MYGAMLGDMVGAPYEFGESMKRKKFPVFIRRTHFTDDTVMTCAVADALIVSKLTSGMVVVVRQNYVEKAVLENTITQLRYHKANILGFVENYAEDEGGYYQKRYYRKEGYYRKENES